jgi:F-type H+-transporting ATPase subunit delta
MLASLIAERYAKALLRAAQAQGSLADIGAQAETLRLGLVSAESAAAFLGDPLAQPQGKLEILSGIFEGGAHPILKAFLLAVLEQKRERFLPAILHKFAELRDEAEGRSTGSLGTARPLAPAERKLLEATLSRRLGRAVALVPYTDKGLLGGAVLKLGDTVFDGTLRMRLAKLGRLLAQGAQPSAPSAGRAKAPSTRGKAAAPKAKPSGGPKKKAAPKRKTAKKGKI